MGDKASILPLSNYFGPAPDPSKDPFNRRKVQQLNDIYFSEDSEDDFEDVRSIKRQRKTVLTEENLRRYLCDETTKLDIDHHHWLKESFLNKIGRMAPNLRRLSLRRLRISNQGFTDIVSWLPEIKQIDISDCFLIESSGLMKLIEVGGSSLTHLEASNCQDAIVDDVLKALANLETGILEVLNISYCKQVTDEGLQAFENKVLPMTRLCLSGLIAVTGKGL